MNFDFDQLLHATDLSIAALVRASLQGGLAALVVASVCRLAPSIPARVQSWLWRLVVVKFLVALFVVVPIPVPFDLPLGLSLHLSPAAPLQAATEPHITAPLAEITSPALATTGPTDTFHADVAPLPAAASSTPAFPILAAIFVAWATIAAWQLARIVAACRNAQLLRRRCRPSDDRRLLEPLDRLSRLAGLAQSPAVLETDGQGSPLLVGILNPAIVLPTSTLARLTPSERSLVLGHELAHIGRRDLLCSLLAAIVRALFFFHPLAWLSERRLALAQEIAADEMAIAMQNQNPIDYASLLLSVVGKLGPARSGRAAVAPLMSIGAAGTHRSLTQRLSAMRYIGRHSARMPLVSGSMLSLCAVFAAVPLSFTGVAANGADRPKPAAKNDADAKAAENRVATRAKASPDRLPQPAGVTSVMPAAARSPRFFGRFVSLNDRVLTIETNSLERIATQVPDDAKATVWSSATHKFEPTEIDAALRQLSPGLLVVVNGAEAGPIVKSGKVTLRIGTRKSRTIGKFVSYKDDRLLILGTNLAGHYAKKSGSSIHFNKFRPDVPAFESVDGRDYRSIGLAKDVLGQVKEGTFVTVHGEGDDNITLVEIGVPKAK
jgi:beta-lactamase regulating signal transducer with metallopeptidase domain